MIKKEINPIIETVDGKKEVTGSKTEYRVLGILVYQKVLYTPLKYGFSIGYEFYTNY